MIQAGICNGKMTRSGLTPDEITDFIHNAGKKQVLWVEVVNPTEEEWNLLGDRFKFHPLAIEDARAKSERAKMDLYPESELGAAFAFLSLRVWQGNDDATADLDDVTQEIDIFVGPNYIVTIHEKECATITAVRSRWENNPDRLFEVRQSPAYLLYLIIDAAVDECFPAMDRMDAEIDDLESAIYEGETAHGENLTVKPALRLRKKLLLLRQTVTPLRDIINQILRTDDAKFPGGLRAYFQDAYDHALRLVEQVDLHRDILSGVLDAIMAQTSNRLNIVMKKMTGISTILMSAALVAGIYGMNFANMPELKATNGYYYALLGMVALSLILSLLFRRIGWF